MVLWPLENRSTVRSIVTFVTARVAGIGIDEQFLDRHFSADQPLLMAIANNGLEIFSVGFAQAVRPRIWPESFLLFVPRVCPPGEGYSSRLSHAPIGDV